LYSTAQELSQRQFEPMNWLKPGLLPLPNLALIAGAPKCGKSWFAMGIARDIASECNIVVYIANEDNERRLKDRYAKISDFTSPNLIFMSGLSSDKPLPKGDAAHEFIRAVKAKYQPLKCIIIDTIQAIRDPNQKDHYGVVEAEFGKLRKLAHELNITIVAVHHTKKKTDFEVEPLDQILGSQAISATVETIFDPTTRCRQSGY
jgi:predicted ATP-dependent serine protease